jgi:integral membrane protein
MNPVRLLRTVGLLEGASYILLLFVAMPLKYFFALPMAVRITGMAHGVLFILFVYALLRAAQSRRWPWKRAGMVFVAALLPFGPLFIDKMLRAEANATS